MWGRRQELKGLKLTPALPHVTRPRRGEKEEQETAVSEGGIWRRRPWLSSRRSESVTSRYPDVGSALLLHDTFDLVVNLLEAVTVHDSCTHTNTHTHIHRWHFYLNIHINKKNFFFFSFFLPVKHSRKSCSSLMARSRAFRAWSSDRRLFRSLGMNTHTHTKRSLSMSTVFKTMSFARPLQWRLKSKKKKTPVCQSKMNMAGNSFVKCCPLCLEAATATVHWLSRTYKMFSRDRGRMKIAMGWSCAAWSLLMALADTSRMQCFPWSSEEGRVY